MHSDQFVQTLNTNRQLLTHQAAQSTAQTPRENGQVEITHEEQDKVTDPKFDKVLKL